jgi:hypothetical protein
LPSSKEFSTTVAELIAILQRAFGVQVEFIIAFDDLTKEGYRLMVIDEGKTAGGQE